MGTKVKTGVVRMNYCHFFHPRASTQNAEEKFSGQFFVPKTDKETVQRIQEAIKGEIASRWGKKTPPSLKIAFKDGDDPNQLPDSATPGAEPYEGHYFFNATANKDSAPGVVDDNRQPILDPGEINWGDFGRVSASIYSYDNVSKGVSFGLNNVQWLYKGEPLGSRTRAEDDFNDDFKAPEMADFLA
tara:strand:- start:618 stop:1178 length:561 start_codon:yes stop_codon:yes gene_type:complete